MVKKSFSSDSDQYDPKTFRESLGSFGTTTVPGQNQLTELQAKVRQGVKHVELHLASQGKGSFNTQDVPDKYGFEQRRTIMQLAKLNNQTLSVHGSFDIVSFSGLGQGGFNEAQRATNMKEIDETLKFAAETAKQGAVVFHLQGDALSTSRSELNLSKDYINWLKKNRPDEFERLKKDYFDSNPLERQFVDNIDLGKEIREEYDDLRENNPTKYREFQEAAKLDTQKREPWELYYINKNIEKAKVAPDVTPLTVVGDKIDQVQRQTEIVDITKLNKNNFSNDEKEILKKLDIQVGADITVEDFQKAQGIFSNGLPEEYKDKISSSDFKKLRDKLLIKYENFLDQNYNLQGQADRDFKKKIIDVQIELAELQRKDIEENYEFNKDYIPRLRELKQKQRELNQKSRNAKTEEEKRKLKLEADRLRRQTLELQYGIGQLEFQKLEKHDELVAQYNEQIRDLKDQRGNVKSITDETFNKNTTAMGHLAIKALRYQLDMKQKSKEAQDKVKEINSTLKDLQNKIDGAISIEEKNRLRDKFNKERYRLKKWVGVKNYEDIDLINSPLYLAPENMLPGYGSLTNLEEYKGVIRMSQEEFAKRILTDEPEYKRLREEYERETGFKIRNREDALKVAKRHLGGTFDNAHAGAWYKHFKKIEGESEEHRIERFNKWLNTEAEKMYEEGIIKHVHFNDTQGKDDDHNLLGQGFLDIHDLKDRLRKKGFRESFIVEAGGRGGNSNMHLLNAFDIFAPSLFSDSELTGGTGYKLPLRSDFKGGQSVSDWMEVKRDYDTRPQYSRYGMSYSTFRHQGPPQGQPRGSWSGTGFL